MWAVKVVLFNEVKPDRRFTAHANRSNVNIILGMKVEVNVK